MSIDRIAQLKSLYLYGMAAVWSEWQAECAVQQKPVMPEVWLNRLIEAELIDRQARSLNYQLKAARFPIHRDLMQFEWHESPLQQARLEQLAHLDAVILDELGYLPFPESGGALLFHLISHLYEKHR